MKSLLFLILISVNAEVINESTLQEYLFKRNNSLMIALQNVQISKTNVNKARANLFPSLNLGFLLPVFGQSSFLLNSVSFLLPFLVPNNWAYLDQQKFQLESDKLSFKIVQLNLLANALSLFYTTIHDQKILKITENKRLLLKKKFENLKQQAELIGNVTSLQLQTAESELIQINQQVRELNYLVEEELLNLKLLLKVDSVVLDAGRRARA